MPPKTDTPTNPTDPLSRIENLEEARPSSFILERLKRLIQPAPAGPEVHDDELFAAAINKAFDGASKKKGASHEARVGQAFTLCIEAVLGTATTGMLSSPLAHLLRALYKWGRLTKPAKKENGDAA